MKIAVAILNVLLVIVYPLAVFWGLAHLGTRTLGLLMLAVVIPGMALRFRSAKREDLWAALRVPLSILAVILAAVALDDARVLLFVPVLINLVLLLTFGASLRGPVSLIERFARLQKEREVRLGRGEGTLSDGQVAHCRQVTWVWCAFFLLNALVAAALALFAPRSWWTFYNGGLTYALMGLLFVGERFVRAYRFREFGPGLPDRLLRRLFPPAPEAAAEATREIGEGEPSA